MKKRKTKKISEAKKHDIIHRFIRNAIKSYCDKEGIYSGRRKCFNYAVDLLIDYINNDNFKSVTIFAGMVDDIEFERLVKKAIRLFYSR